MVLHVLVGLMVLKVHGFNVHPFVQQTLFT